MPGQGLLFCAFHMKVTIFNLIFKTHTKSIFQVIPESHHQSKIPDWNSEVFALKGPRQHPSQGVYMQTQACNLLCTCTAVVSKKRTEVHV